MTDYNTGPFDLMAPEGVENVRGMIGGGMPLGTSKTSLSVAPGDHTQTESHPAYSRGSYSRLDAVRQQGVQDVLKERER